MNRLALAWKSVVGVFKDPEFAGRVEGLLAKTPTGVDLRILAVLQRDGRLIDFLQENLDAYTDAQIGAAVRDIHRGCKKSLTEYLRIEPVLDGREEEPTTIAPGFDPSEIRLTGNVKGSPPFQGVLKHAGWKVTSIRLPSLPGMSSENAILAPAEVEIS